MPSKLQPKIRISRSFLCDRLETTAPANAMAVIQAEKLGLDNFSILPANVLVPPAMHAILSSPNNRIQGFLAAGHVCAIMAIGNTRHR